MPRVLSAALAAALAASAAAATPAVGLTGARTLILFDTDAPAKARAVELRGVQRLAGLDMRPADGALMGLTMDGALVRIDAATGATQVVAALKAPMPAGDGPITVDFNPAADKLRVLRGTANLRVDPDSGATTVDGALAFDPADPRAAAAPAVVAAAYANSRGKPEKTAMYDVDAALPGLLRQAPPNDGVLKTIGAFGVAGPVYAFDIATDAAGVNTGWLATGGVLHRVDLATGAAVAAGRLAPVAAGLRDLTVLIAD